MTRLGFDVLEITAAQWVAVPTLTVRLAVTATDGDPVHAAALRVQIRIEPQRRGYGGAEQEALADLFGGQERYGSTLRPFLWTHATALVPGFSERTEIDLPVPCTYDFDVAAAKYLHGLGDGVVPLSLLFSGTVFTRGGGGFTVTQVPWDAEAVYRMPVAVWRQAMDACFPGSAWLRISRDMLTRLQAYKSGRALLSWDDALDRLLKAADEVDGP